MKIWILFWGVFLLSACSTQSAKPLSTAEKSMPDWFLNLPNDTGRALYGAGQGDSREGAIQAALVDLASQLSIQVASDFETHLNVKESTYTLVDRTTQKKIRSRVSDIAIQDYQVLEVEQLAYDKFVALVEVNRLKLFDDLKKHVQQQMALLQAAEQTHADSSILVRYLFYKNSLDGLKTFEQSVSVLKTLKPTFSTQSYRHFLTHFQRQAMDLKSQVQWVIQSDGQSQKWVSIIQYALNQQGFQVRRLTDSSRVSVIRLSTTLNSSEAYGFYITRVVLNIDVMSQGVSIGGNQLRLKGQAVKSFDQALNHAAAKLQKRLDQQGVNQVIGFPLL